MIYGCILNNRQGLPTVIGNRHLGGAGFLMDKMILEVLLHPPKSASHQPLATDTEIAIDRKDPFYYGPPKNKVWRHVRWYSWNKRHNKDKGSDKKDRGSDNNGRGSDNNGRGSDSNQLRVEREKEEKMMGVWNWTAVAAEGGVVSWSPPQTNVTKKMLIDHCITLQLGGNWCSYHSDWALYDCVMKEKMTVRDKIVINSIKLDKVMHQSRRFLPPGPSPVIGAVNDTDGTISPMGTSPSQQQQQQKFVRYIKDKVMHACIHAHLFLCSCTILTLTRMTHTHTPLSFSYTKPLAA